MAELPRLNGVIRAWEEGKPAFTSFAQAEIETAVAYFLTEWQTLPDRHLAGVRSAVTQLVDDFTSDPIAQIISGPSTISIAEIIDQGRLLYVHFPLAGHERMTEGQR